MSVREELKNQLNVNKYSEDAKKCLKIYNKLLELEGCVWNSQWRILVTVQRIGKHLNSVKIYKPTKIGEIFLNGIQ